MSNIDLITSWPSHLDYPLWREFIHDNRKQFDKVIIVFTNMSIIDPDYRLFIKEATKKDDLILVDNNPVRGDQDWRDVAVNKGLEHSNARWVFFTEEDFFPKNGFWDQVKRLKKYPSITAFGAWYDSRLHPCCIFVRRVDLNKTHKYFGVVKDKLDHFGQFQQELVDIGPVLSIDSEYYQHLNGLSQNMHMLQTGEKPNFRPEEFKEYLKKCLEVKVALHPNFIKLANEYLLW